MKKFFIDIKLSDILKSIGCNKCGARHRYHINDEFLDCYRCGHTFEPAYDGRWYLDSLTEFGSELYERNVYSFRLHKNKNSFPIGIYVEYGDSIIRLLNKQRYPNIWK